MAIDGDEAVGDGAIVVVAIGGAAIDVVAIGDAAIVVAVGAAAMVTATAASRESATVAGAMAARERGDSPTKPSTEPRTRSIAFTAVAGIHSGRNSTTTAAPLIATTRARRTGVPRLLWRGNAECAAWGEKDADRAPGGGRGSDDTGAANDRADETMDDGRAGIAEERSADEGKAAKGVELVWTHAVRAGNDDEAKDGAAAGIDRGRSSDEGVATTENGGGAVRDPDTPAEDCERIGCTPDGVPAAAGGTDGIAAASLSEEGPGEDLAGDAGACDKGGLVAAACGAVPEDADTHRTEDADWGGANDSPGGGTGMR